MIHHVREEKPLWQGVRHRDGFERGMRIAETFESVQGEGRLTGTPSFFVRTSGCNLRCVYCDTPYTSWQPEGQVRSMDALMAELGATACQHVVITGGEPMLLSEMTEFTRRLAAAKRHITIETAGTVDQPVNCDLMSISPKRPNSTPTVAQAGAWSQRHEATRHNPQVIRRLVRDYDYQLKFVIAESGDIEDVQRYLTEFPEVDHDHVWLMPEGTAVERLTEVSDWLQAACRTKGFRYCPRKHIEWFGHQRGT